MKNEGPTIGHIRQRLTPIQANLLNACWERLVESGKWPLLRPIYRDHGKANVVEALASMSGLVSEEEDGQSGNRCALSLPAVMLTKDAKTFIGLIERYLRFQFDLFKTEEVLRQIKSEEIAKALNFSQSETKLLGRLLVIGREAFGHSEDLSIWSVRTMKEAEDYTENTDFAVEAERLVMKSYYPGYAVFIEDRRRQPPLGSAELPVERRWPFDSTQTQSSRPADVNPFERRYQTFVSSTFNDLIEERKHVMQALLETKCIPSGMELFPAASTEQMHLIQGVIDDCDYYVVIVAGKYGSCSPSGIGFTEMEFDYAVKTKKPILAFFHSDIRKLAGDKLEETDEGRRKLCAFTAKVKHQRLCRSWNTAEGLASAIKTAIIHAIETNPKPGWVRADSVPTWNMVKTLEHRIAELEGRPEPQIEQRFPDDNDRIEVPAKITWYTRESSKSRWDLEDHHLQKTFSLTWDALFCHVAPEPGTSTTRNGLYRSFGHSLAKEAEGDIKKESNAPFLRLAATVDPTLFDRILNTFLARKLLKQISPPRRVSTRIPYWQLAPKGVQKLAELRAIRPSPV